jgi:hypothetical protein
MGLFHSLLVIEISAAFTMPSRVIEFASPQDPTANTPPEPDYSRWIDQEAVLDEWRLLRLAFDLAQFWAVYSREELIKTISEDTFSPSVVLRIEQPLIKNIRDIYALIWDLNDYLVKNAPDFRRISPDDIQLEPPCADTPPNPERCRDLASSLAGFAARAYDKFHDQTSDFKFAVERANTNRIEDATSRQRIALVLQWATSAVDDVAGMLNDLLEAAGCGTVIPLRPDDDTGGAPLDQARNC